MLASPDSGDLGPDRPWSRPGSVDAACPGCQPSAPRFATDTWFPPCPCSRGSSQRFAFKHNLYRLREERDIKPSAFGQMVSATLYERRFGPYFCQPVIGGWVVGWLVDR